MRLGIAPLAVLTVLAAFGAAAGDEADLVPRQPIVLVRPPDARRPSEAQIVFEAPGVPGGNDVQEIFTMNLDGTHRAQLTQDGLNKFLPHFSPDGTQLVYSKFLVGRYGDSNPHTEIVRYDFATGRETRLTDMGQAFAAAWSPDGKRIAFGTYHGDSLWIMNADGSSLHAVGGPSGGLDDLRWNDIAWSSDDWIVFTVGQNVDGCFKVRLDKIRPDGTDRMRITDGGPYCTPPGKEQSGDADPGISADGRTIYSSRGFPYPPPGLPSNVVRRLYSFSSDPWTPGKVERNLSLPTAPDCVEGVPKSSPDGSHVLLFCACAGERFGVTLTDAAGTYRTWLADGFGADWNPAANHGK